MSRLGCIALAAALAVGFLGVPLVHSQTEPASPADQSAPAAKGKKGMTADEKAKAKEERRATRKKVRDDKQAAKKAKRAECRDQAKQNNLKGRDLRAFVKTCVAG